MATGKIFLVILAIACGVAFLILHDDTFLIIEMIGLVGLILYNKIESIK